MIPPMKIKRPRPTLPTYICPIPGIRKERIAAIAESFSLICLVYDAGIGGVADGTGGAEEGTGACGVYVGGVDEGC